MTRQTQKWYDKPFTKLILVTIALTWIFPVFGFVLSSFRPGEAIKRESWWDAIYTGKLWTELTLSNYSEIFLSLIHISEPRDKRQSRMPSSA